MVSSSFIRCFLILKLIVFFQIVQVTSVIKGPTKINGHVGEDAYFKWSTTDQVKILSVSWGIRKGNIADPQFINVNVYNNKVNKNEDLEEALRKRIKFIGNLHKGHAWFVLKNLTVTDTNEYIASIIDNGKQVLPYYVPLEVFEKKRESTTVEYENTTKSANVTELSTVDYYENMTKNANVTVCAEILAVAYNQTALNQLCSTNRPAQLNNGLLMLMAIALVMW